jgi:quercetin dioxygenase-like cupin family protein
VEYRRPFTEEVAETGPFVHHPSHMKKTKTKVNFKDARGEIRDLITHTPVDAVTLITCTKGAIRGNHYHKKTTQYDYVLSGSLVCVSQDMQTGKRTRTTLRTGDVAVHPPYEAHAFQATEPSTFLSLTKGPRNGADYENDTIRLDTPLIAPKKR